MDLERALDLEFGRVLAVARAASRVASTRRPWWVGAMEFLSQVVL